ncbi:hypothetical protein SHIRM173S_12594 [Streptomyces hirsutus]
MARVKQYAVAASGQWTDERKTAADRLQQGSR